MRRALLLGLLAGLGLGLAAGCATVTMTPEENLRHTRQVFELDLRELADDWNYVWLTDRQCRLTRWYTR